MNAAVLVRYVCAAIVAGALLAFVPPAYAQLKPAPAPSATALANAKELVEIIGAAREFDPLVTGVIVTSASTFLQSNPRYAKDLNDIVDQLVTEYHPRRVELPNKIITLYATRLTEQELKDAVAFYKSALGKKLLTESNFILSETFKEADTWSAKLREEVTAKIRAELKKRGHNL
jgi:uncharacterized protein